MELEAATQNKAIALWPLLILYCIVCAVFAVDDGMDTTSVIHTPENMVPPFMYKYAEFTLHNQDSLRPVFLLLGFANAALLVTFCRKSKPYFWIAIAIAFIQGVVSGVMRHIAGNAFGMWEDGHTDSFRLEVVLQRGVETCVIQLFIGVVCATGYFLISEIARSAWWEICQKVKANQEGRRREQ